jgi:hypothetical protein
MYEIYFVFVMGWILVNEDFEDFFPFIQMYVDDFNVNLYIIICQSF